MLLLYKGFLLWQSDITENDKDSNYNVTICIYLCDIISLKLKLHEQWIKSSFYIWTGERDN